ncbi:hypothetical protein CYMTET_13641 [Cymbomonas tetramitiformis]|uniref:TatD related DNase n=1 Tax=Cymbomonas tetramitiformis TaxID=36881 RepID=A0AAE0LAV3_9CHLO|nr:hypothetical protein CYMTET_13641 [Cymbomonas tetramitiformis]
MRLSPFSDPRQRQKVFPRRVQKYQYSTPKISRRRKRSRELDTQAMATVKIDGPSTEETSRLFEHIADSHCHPQEDPDGLAHIERLSSKYLAVMGLREDDWPRVAELQAAYPHKVIPCFGVHPWFAHLHGFRNDGFVRDVLEIKADLELQNVGDVADVSLSISWEATLRKLLEAYPSSIVGEIGIDKAAVVLGTNNKARTRLSHQLELTERQLSLAAEYNRPASLHCVRAYGHLQDLFRKSDPCTLPPRIMLHSFGGNPEVVKGFTRMPRVGGRFYFSFSNEINCKTPAKTLERIRQVPDDRVLLESDTCSATTIDSGLLESCKIIAEAKGWTLQQCCEITFQNFRDFYVDSLPKI